MNISQKPSLNLWSWLPDMERDILSPLRRVDILFSGLGRGWGIFGASHGYYRRPGDGNKCVCACV